MQSRLTRTISIILQTRHTQCVNTANVDNTSGIASSSSLVRCGGCPLGGFFQQRGEELGEREDALEVEGEEFGPGVVWVRVKGLAPGGAGVVDEDVEAVGLALGEGGGERFAGVEGLEVGGQGDG